MKEEKIWIQKEIIEEVVAIDPLKVMSLFPDIRYRKSGRYITFPCPIHKGKDHNFKINLDTKHYCCYSHGCCNGSNINFLMEMNNINFIESCNILSSLEGISLTGDKIDKVAYQKTKIDYYINKYINDNKKDVQILVKNNESNRKIYIPKNDGVHPNILEKNFLSSTLLDFGVYYNKKMNRIVFLIKDFNGKVVGWKARAITEEQKKEKKFDSPYNFNSGNYFYGGDITLPHILSSRKVILVEGHWDVLRLFEKGYYNVLGIMGSNITDYQAEWLIKNVHTIYPAFDPDQGGDKAFVQSYLKLRSEINVDPIELPMGKDPDELNEEEFKLFNVAS